MEKNTNPAGSVIARLEEDECDEAGMFMGTARVVPMVVVAPIIERLEARIAALEAERAEREKQNPVAWINEKNGFICKDPKNYDFCVPLYAALPITSPVRLTDEQVETTARNHGTGGWQTLADMTTFARAIETAVLRANGFNIDHPEHALELVGLRGCNSRHGGAREPDPCVYRYLMRTTDTGCTGCADRGEDQPTEAGGCK